jgi:hypothetical protein
MPARSALREAKFVKKSRLKRAAVAHQVDEQAQRAIADTRHQPTSAKHEHPFRTLRADTRAAASLVR